MTAKMCSLEFCLSRGQLSSAHAKRAPECARYNNSDKDKGCSGDQICHCMICRLYSVKLWHSEY